LDLKGNPFFLTNEDIEWVQNTYNSLSLEDKIGQLFIFNCSLLGLKRELKDILNFKPGGETCFSCGNSNLYYLSKKGFQVKKYKKGIKKKFKDYNLIIFLLNEMPWYTSTTLRLIHLQKDPGMMRSIHNEVPCLFISFSNPYHLYEIPSMKTLINC